MIPIITSRLSSTCCRFRQRAGRSLLLLPLIGCVLACVSCQDQGPPIVDVSPLGEGLKVIGYAVVGAAVLGVLGKLVK
jgi:hypothetical protein